MEGCEEWKEKRSGLACVIFVWFDGGEGGWVDGVSFLIPRASFEESGSVWVLFGIRLERRTRTLLWSFGVWGMLNSLFVYGLAHHRDGHCRSQLAPCP